MRKGLHILNPLSSMVTTLLFLACHSSVAQVPSKAAGELVWAIRYDPKTLDPAKVDDQASEMVRYLTAGVLIRVNRHTQHPEPALADSWRLSSDGREISFHLRNDLHFSDGSLLTSRDVAWSLRRVLNPATEAPVAEEFLSPREVKVDTPDLFNVHVHLSKRVVGVERLFDEIAIEPENRPNSGRVTSGPYIVAEYKLGQFVRLHRNASYWKHDVSGVQLPYIREVRLEVVKNREEEIARFQKGEYDLIDSLSPEYFDLLAVRNKHAVFDLGPSLNSEQMWFNQAANAPLPDFEKAWFRNRAFRIAVSRAIHRADLARIAYGGHAKPAYGFISPANASWYNSRLVVPSEDLAASRNLLIESGFHLSGGCLYDSTGHAVRFSILTNAGNDARKKMATLIQQDLAALGMQVNVVTLDFPALVERLMHTQDYESCLLGLANVDPDPNSMMNLWLSSSSNHQWNPSEKTPATQWEAEIDAQMQEQATTASIKERKQAVDRVQQIVADEQPFIYLVYPDALYAVSPNLTGVEPSVLQPGIVWNVEELRWQRPWR